jgi:histidyl-tRNA synthetase
MKIPPVKGTRDFYPPEMAVRNFILDGWKKVSLRNGFEEYDGPIFEYLKMFQIKSGDEIVEQLFSLKDRGGRDLALRPEITPTLARMVNQRINALPKPIKWFSVPRLFRAERPQKGRLREFFQWNIDIIGVEADFEYPFGMLADAEIIFTTIDYLQQVGLTKNDIEVKISSRKLLAAFLKSIGIAEKDLDPMYALLDKKPKMPPDTFEVLLDEKLSDKVKTLKILEFMKLDLLSKVERFIGVNPEVDKAVNELLELGRLLNQMEIADFCKFDPSIVRGLAYYTGIVFEVHDIAGDLRAICGGGRYDNLLRDFGGPDIPAVGMGMGDCILEILLRERRLLGEKIPKQEPDYFVIPVVLGTYDDEHGSVESTPEDEALKLTAKLRGRGFRADLSYKLTSISKLLQEASSKNARKCIIVGEEFKDRKLVVKDMATGEQELVDYDTFLSGLDIGKGEK